MKHQPNRLPADARHGWGGDALDRNRPLTFRLNGRTYEGFAGDTVLSALFAAGVDALGTYRGEPVALNERFAPPIAPAGTATDPARALPMERTPVVAGLDLVTLGPLQSPMRLGGIAGRIAGMVLPRPTTLGHRLDEPRLLLGPWLGLPATVRLEADTIVVGGGIAGMGAALAAAAAGQSVLLVERRPALGGDARFFGTIGDETPPEEWIGQLAARIATTPAITVLLATDAFGLTGTRLAAHQVRLVDGRPHGQTLSLSASRIVLATGTAERLPVFPGNRLPAVVGAVAAFTAATRYGVWPGRRAIVAMPHSFGYRLALQAADAGIEVQRAADSRIDPQSRFVDFCKASGITLASGQLVRMAETGGKGGRLAVSFAVAMDEAARETGSIATDLLVAAGGWQPRLGLWLMAGGSARWDVSRHWLGARGSIDGVALAGAAAGYRGSAACLASGEQAIAVLLGRPAQEPDDPQLDSIYESRDAPTPIAPWRSGRAAYLDRAASFTPRPAPRREEPAAPALLAGLSLGDVAASVQVGAIPAADAGTIAEERCVAGGDVADSGWRVTDGPPATMSPPFLNGRFGPRPQLLVIEASDARFFEAGCLLHATSETTDPLAAIGVVVGAAPGDRPGGLAIANRAALVASSALFVRDTSGAVAVTIVEKEKKKPKAT